MSSSLLHPHQPSPVWFFPRSPNLHHRRLLRLLRHSSPRANAFTASMQGRHCFNVASVDAEEQRPSAEPNAGGCLYSIHEYFDFYSTPHDERVRLVGLCIEGHAAQWFRWMKSKRTKILVPAVIASPSTSSPPWAELPTDVTANILHRVGAEGMLTSAQQVCTTWWKVSKDPALWRVIDFSNPRQGVFNDEYNVMCRCAVDRSQGQLVDLTIQYFGDDALLDYIIHR